jgi:hypothetical protein
MIHLTCDDCGADLGESPAIKSNWPDYWRAHGHMPGRVTLTCDCGCSLATGPLVIRDVKVAREVHEEFEALHQGHGVA